MPCLHETEIRIEKTEAHLFIHVAGVKYNCHTLSKKLGLANSTIRRKFNAEKSEEKRILWIRKKLWLLDQALSYKLQVYYRDGFFISLCQIMSITGLRVGGAMARARKFAKGGITKEDLLGKPRSKPGFNASCIPNWGGLKGGEVVSQKKLDFLDTIPSPTKHEYRIGKVFTNHRPVGLANGLSY